MNLLEPKYFQSIFEKYRQSTPFFPLIGSVLECTQNGLVLTDSLTNPTSFFITHKFGFSQLFEIHSNGYFDNSLFDLFLDLQGKEKCLPQKIRLYSPPEKWTKRFDDNIRPHVAKSERVQLKPDINLTEKITPDEEIENLNQHNINEIDDALQLEVCSRFWNTCTDVIQNGYGCTLRINNKIVSLCYSAATSNMTAEIDIATAEDHRRKGYASRVVRSFMQRCSSEKIISNWDCYTNNQASYGLARSLGFKESFIYDFYIIDLSSAH